MYLFEKMAEHSHEVEATAAVLQLDTYSRPSDILAVRGEDIILPRIGTGAKYGHVIAVNFAPGTRPRTSKTGRQDDCIVVGLPPRQCVRNIVLAVQRAVTQ